MAIKGESKKEAVIKARLLGRVKHYDKKAIISVEEVHKDTFEDVLQRTIRIHTISVVTSKTKEGLVQNS